MVLLTAGVHYFVTAPEKEEAEATVMIKSVKKGLYLSPLIPRYEIMVEGSDKATKVSKDTFNALEIGDEIEGYMRADRHFVTEDQIKSENIYFIPLLIGIYVAWLIFILNALGLMKFIERREKLNNALKHIITGLQITVLAIWFLVGALVTCLIAINVFHKVNASNLIETEAIVLDKSKKTVGSSKGFYTTYELLLRYSDEEGMVHVTNKAVTGETYWAYDDADLLTLFYRKNNVEDTFVQARSFGEIWQVFVNLFTFVLGLYFLSVYFLIRYLRKKLRAY